MNRQHLIRRLLYLRNWEFINIFFLPACLWFSLTALKAPNWQPYAYGMAVLCVILAQGVLYWHLKLETVRGNEAQLPEYFARLFTLFKRLDAVLLVVYPVLALFGKATGFAGFQASIWANLLFLFTVLEYLNYYHYQLSYDNVNDLRYLLKHKVIRKSHLAVDMEKSRRSAPAG